MYQDRRRSNKLGETFDLGELFNRFEIRDDLRHVCVADLRLGNRRHVAQRTSDQLERRFVAPFERHEAGSFSASSLSTVALAASLFVEALAGLLGGGATHPHACGE